MGVPLGVDGLLGKHSVEDFAKAFDLNASQGDPDLSERVTRLVPFKSHAPIMPLRQLRHRLRRQAGGPPAGKRVTLRFPPLPEPLGSAVAAFRGLEQAARFCVA